MNKFKAKVSIIKSDRVHLKMMILTFDRSCNNDVMMTNSKSINHTTYMHQLNFKTN